jgi:hypothetical protein
MDKDFKITDRFNFVSRDKDLTAYTLTLTRPAADLDAQAGSFADTLARWLMMQGEDFKGNAKKPEATTAEGGNARVRIEATEEMMARIERQFGGDILRADPPPAHARGTVYPPKVDPFDISKW